MIFTILRLSYWRLLNNPMELVLMFVVPIGFFTIFALILGKGIGGGKFPQTKTALLIPSMDSEHQAASSIAQSLRSRLKDYPTIKILDEINLTNSDQQQAEIKAREIISNGVVTAVIELPLQMLAEKSELSDSKIPPIRIYIDQSDTIAGQSVRGACQQILIEEMLKQSTSQLAQNSAPETTVTPPQNAPPSFTLNPPMINIPPPLTESMTSSALSTQTMSTPAGVMKMPEFEVIDALESQQTHRKYAMYAAGIAVMFLLFSASGAGGMLLEEKEAGTLERLLCTRLGITQLLIGKWLTITLNGLIQMIVMFAWAQFIFQVDFVGHLPEFMVMSTLTSGAAASLALMLAAVSRTRAQLNGIAVILILSMSALGGSMVPRYIMSDELKAYGKITFNAWALDGYDKIFWRNQPLESLQLECLVLLASILLLGLIARIFAQSWVNQS